MKRPGWNGFAEIKIQPPVGMPLSIVRVAVFDNSAVPGATNPYEPLKEPTAITALGAPAPIP